MLASQIALYYLVNFTYSPGHNLIEQKRLHSREIQLFHTWMDYGKCLLIFTRPGQQAQQHITLSATVPWKEFQCCVQGSLLIGDYCRSPLFITHRFRFTDQPINTFSPLSSQHGRTNQM